MADQRVTELVAVVTPALTDVTAVRQSGDDRDKKATVQQILSLASVDISNLTGGNNNDMLFKRAGVWIPTGPEGLSYDGFSMILNDDNLNFQGTAQIFNAGTGNWTQSSTGQIRAAVGTVALPGSVFTDETTTGVYRPGAGIYAISVLGVEKLRVKSTGVDVTGNLVLLGNGRPRLIDSAGGAGIPTVVPDGGDLGTGWGSQGSTNNLAGITGGVRAVAWRATGAGNGAIEYTADVTIGNPASTTQTQGQGTQNSAEYSRTTTVTNPDDVITLGSATEGRKTLVTNRGANRLQIFPALGSDLGEGVNVSMFLEVGESTTFFAISSGIWQRISGIGSVGAGGTTFPEFQFTPHILENPNNADWAVNALAPAQADNINAGLTVRRFDDTTEEGVGFTLEVPAGATNIVFGFTSRAVSPQPTLNTIGVNVYNRGLPDDGAVQAWSAGDQLTDLDLPNSTNFVKDSESVTLASLGVTAGEVTQFEITRVAPAGDDQVGDWAVLQVRISFT